MSSSQTSVSKAMIAAVPYAAEYQTEHNYEPDVGIDSVDGFIENPDEIAQGVINAAWTKFDDDDESTWPAKIFGKNGSMWLVFCRNKNGSDILRLCWFQNKWRGSMLNDEEHMAGQFVLAYTESENFKPNNIEGFK